MTETSNRLKPLKGEASRILKLCLEKDVNTALQGLELAAALDMPLEGLLDEVMVDKEGKLIRGKRFTAKEKTQAILDALLLQQLGLASTGSPQAKIRNSITKLECRLAVLPNLSNFAGLKDLQITLSETFKDKDLTGLGSLGKLKSLMLSTGSGFYGVSRTATLESLSGLDAPILENFEASLLDLNNIDALSACSKLKRVAIRGNERISSIDSLESSASSLQDLDIGFCSAINSLKSIKNASKLRYLDISGLDHIQDLLDLKNLTSLESIELYGCEGLTSFKGLPLASISDFRRPSDKASDSLILDGLNSLRSFKYFPPLDPSVIELQINRAVALTDLSDLANFVGLIRVLYLDQVGVADLQDLEKFVNLETLEIKQCQNLEDATSLAKLKKLISVRITGCKKLLKLPETWASPVRRLVLTGCKALMPLKALPPGIDAKTIEIDDRKLLPRAKSTKPLKSDVGAVWKLLSSRDLSNIFMGLELSAALAIEDLNTLIADVSVQGGNLMRGKRFTGTGPAQPYLDMALFGLMAKAPTGSKFSKLSAQITQLELTLPSKSFSIVGFTSLAKLTLHTGDGTTSDLIGFGIMPKLTELKINGGRWGASGGLKSLKGLNAPILNKVDLSHCKLEDIEALNHSSKITQLDLSNNQGLTNLNGLEACTRSLIELNLEDCEQLQSIVELATAEKIKTLNLSGCKTLTSVLPLACCKSLETLNLEQCSKLRSLEGLALLSLTPEKSYDGSTQFSLDGCSALISLAHLPSFGGNLNSLSVKNTNALQSLEGLNELPTVTSFNGDDSGLSDLQNLSSLPSLTHISLKNCSHLKDVRPLGLLKNLESVKLTNSAVTNLPNGWTSPLSHLVVGGCQSLTSLGLLPSSLVNLVCDGASGLIRLDGMEACNKLEVISVKSCISLIDFGIPPSTVREVMAKGCLKLTSLKGLQNCPQLTTIAVPTTILDVSAIKDLPAITLSIDLFELGKPKVKGQLVTLSDEFIKAINTLPSVSLRLTGPSGRYYEPGVVDLNMFSKFNTVRSLNFIEMDIHCKLEELSWLVNMQELKSLIFYPRGSMSFVLSGGIFDSPNQVKALQLKVCQEAKIKPPQYLLR